MKSAGERLFEEFNGKIRKYRELPQHAKNTIKAYYVDEFGYMIDDEDTFGYVEIPMKKLKDTIKCPDDLPYDNFEDYHKWYMDGGDIPNHQEVWAVILSSYENEVIFDGWHRFHWYVEKGVEVVPCVIPENVKDMKCE